MSLIYTWDSWQAVGYVGAAFESFERALEFAREQWEEDPERYNAKTHCIGIWEHYAPNSGVCDFLEDYNYYAEQEEWEEEVKNNA